MDDFNAGRRRFLGTMGVGAAAAATMTFSIPSMAGEYPDHPLSLIVPWSPGGGTDTALRAFAKSANKWFPQPIVILNMPGAGGTTGPLHIAHSTKADGYAVGQISSGVFRQPAMRKTAWDPLTDFSYISRVAAYRVVIVVRQDSPFHTLQDVIKYARENPGKVSFGSTGVGTGNHLGLACVGLKENVRFTHVPFKGSTESLMALMSGQVTMVSSESARGFIEAGKVRVIAAGGDARYASWPDIPTLREMGYPVSCDGPYGIAGAAGMDTKVVEYLDNIFHKVTQDPEFIAAMDKLDQSVIYMGPQDFMKYAVRETAESKQLIADLGLVEKA
jgi:tripartite-type tricarboxylate transporter receptor subunit TctC